ncbi:MAG: ATP-binding cassette domain-containing protein [Alphaproteobacteria bacterium]|nr:ATP-binding cassette domain-containing protein [Alphaproteobacteria bacterium]
MGLLFQDYALFPHMTVQQNIAYGLKRRKFDRGALDDRVGEMLGLVKLEGLADRRPSQLSGGQQQRVALAKLCCLTSHFRLLMPNYVRNSGSS